jgi:transposase
LRDEAARRYGPRALRPTKLDPYVEYLLERIEHARPDWIPATVLLREIRERGYPGGISQLKAYLAPLKRQAPEPMVRFETAPGQQLQVDFTTVRRGRDRLLAFVATLGYSRSTFVRFMRREDFAAWRDGLLAAFEYFGGVTEEVLFDNAKPVVIERDLYGPGPAPLAPRDARPRHGQPRGAALAGGGRRSARTRDHRHRAVSPARVGPCAVAAAAA